MAGTSWFFMSLSAAILWGASYALSERVLKDYNIAPSFILVVEGFLFLSLSIIIILTQGTFKSNFEILTTNKSALINLIIVGLLNIAGAYLIYTSISLKNASMSNIVEISYPFFTILFAWFLTRELQVNASVFAGGLLIFAGVTLIYLKS